MEQKKTPIGSIVSTDITADAQEQLIQFYKEVIRLPIGTVLCNMR